MENEARKRPGFTGYFPTSRSPPRVRKRATVQQVKESEEKKKVPLMSREHRRTERTVWLMR